MNQKSERQSPLSSHRAFVVQFRAETDVEAGRYAGRVEHVVSGQAASFQSLDDLLAFITGVLAELDTEPLEEG